MPCVTVGPPREVEREADREHAVTEPQRDERPSGTGMRSVSLTRMIARSRSAAVPITVAATGCVCRPSLNETVTVRAPCDDVVVREDHPARSITTPEPSLLLPSKRGRAHVDDAGQHARDDVGGRAAAGSPGVAAVPPARVRTTVSTLVTASSEPSPRSRPRRGRAPRRR